ncbi:serine hydrolase [Terriglobus aquaticus]|uniref:Serine hydrolase n=1 Tax=Terriglobus aquaticus TaxID=940139 RepID=A0ABW9KJW3_9BACT|nr:serine hydrolase [Terriglobus aquaticus]
MRTPRPLQIALGAILAAAAAHAQTAPKPPAPHYPTPADAAKEIADLPERLADIAVAHHGKVALYAIQLNTGKTAAIDADHVVQTASTIKLALLWEAERQVALGKANWSDKITLQPGEGVAGSGILHFLDTPVTLTLKDVATMMVIVSDNTATNLMIDRFPTAQVDADMLALGLDQTWLYKKVMKPATGPMPADQPKYGLGKTTPRQIASLMERLGRCQLNLPGTPTIDPAKATAACAVGLDMLRNQFYRETVPRYLEGVDSSEEGSAIASKTGSLNATRSDVAIVAAKTGPIVMAIYTYDNEDQGWSVDNEGEVTIAKLAQAIANTWSPAGTDAKQLKPGLGLLVSAGAAAGKRSATATPQ